MTIIGFVGADPEQRQARNNNGSKFTVLSVATQQPWKNTYDEWASKTEWHRVCVFRPRLAEYVSTTIKNGSHVLVEGSLVSTTYEHGNGKGKKAKNDKQTFWCIRADVVRKLDRGEPEANRLSWLFNWWKAEPLYVRAEELLKKGGDTWNEIYARVGRVPGHPETWIVGRDFRDRAREKARNEKIEKVKKFVRAVW